MNQGERDEILFKLATAHLFPGQIRNPGGAVPSGRIPSPSRLAVMDDASLNQLANNAGLGKAPPGAKADCDLATNGGWAGVSLKSNRGAAATILNHTHRAGVLDAANRIGYNLNRLDQCIQEYHALRSRGQIPEDVPNNHPLSPFSAHATDLIPIVNYFLSYGTGRGNSPYPAQYVGTIFDPLQGLNGITVVPAQDFIQNNWHNIRFCMRNKNPSSLPESRPWNVQHDDRVRGELHIRMV